MVKAPATKSERRETKQRRRRFAPKGGTAAGQLAHLKTAKSYRGKARKMLS